MNLIGMTSRIVAEAFVSGLCQGLVLMIVVAGALRMVPRLRATARFVVWGAAFAVAVVLPFVHLPGRGVAGAAEGVRLGVGWGLAIAGCWALLMVVRVAQLVAQGLRLRRIWREASPVESGAGIAGLLKEMPRRPMLCTSAAVDAPSVIGFWAPKLLIPDWQMGDLSDVELRHIVLHECEHLRRGDDWVNLAQKVGLALFPLNPALLWADRRMGLERELACDAGVVERTRAPFDYASCLTRLAEQRIGRRGLVLALSAWGRESELGQRVHRLLKPVGSMGRLPARVSVALLAAAVAGGSLELARMPRLVSFANGGAVREAQILPAGEPVSGARRMPVVDPVVYPVVYREPVQARPMSVSMSPRRLVRKRAGRPTARMVRVQSQGLVAMPARIEAAMIQVSLEERDGSRLVKAMATDLPISYAAVPFANGWLILQL